MKYLYQNNCWELNKIYNIDKLLYIMIDRPNKIEFDNNFVWENDRYQSHRNYNLPARTFLLYKELYYLIWFKNNKVYQSQ